MFLHLSYLLLLLAAVAAVIDLENLPYRINFAQLNPQTYMPGEIIGTPEYGSVQVIPGSDGSGTAVTTSAGLKLLNGAGFMFNGVSVKAFMLKFAGAVVFKDKNGAVMGVGVHQISSNIAVTISDNHRIAVTISDNHHGTNFVTISDNHRTNVAVAIDNSHKIGVAIDNSHRVLNEDDFMGLEIAEVAYGFD